MVAGELLTLNFERMNGRSLLSCRQKTSIFTMIQNFHSILPSITVATPSTLLGEREGVNWITFNQPKIDVVQFMTLRI